MDSGSSSVENLPVKVKTEPNEESLSNERTNFGDLGEDLQTTIKTEEEETLSPSEPLKPPESYAIKTEEIFIVSELPAQEDDSSTLHTSGRTNNHFRCYLCAAPTFLANKPTLWAHLLAFHQQSGMFQCGLCSLKTKDVLAFNKHFKHHEPTTYEQCSQCSVIFTTAVIKKRHEANRTCPGCRKKFPCGKMKEHFESEHPKAMCPCSICGEKFSCEEDLIQHNSLKHGYNPPGHKCYLCESDTVLESKVQLQQHLHLVHSSQPKYQCDWCEYSTRVVEYFNAHLSKHDAIKNPLKCSVCSIRFNQPRMLQYHEMTAHNIGGRNDFYVCPLCNKKFSNGSELTGHMRAHIYKSKLSQPVKDIEDRRKTEQDKHLEITARPPTKCYMCNSLHENAAALKQHINTHYTEELFHCKECDYSTKYPVSFNVHLSKHDTDVNPFKCSICGLGFTNDKNRRYHEVRQHGNFVVNPQSIPPKMESTLRCYLCSDDAMMESKNALLKHLRTTHPTQSVYKCAICNFTTKLKLAFNDHHEQHRKSATMYPCSICRKKFVYESTRIRHERLMHRKRAHTIHLKTTPLKEFVCYLCSIRTVLPNKNQLRKHLRSVHCSLDMYTCRKCTYSTKEKDKFNHHLSWHAPSKRKFKCNSCPRKFLTARSKRCHETFAHNGSSPPRSNSANYKRTNRFKCYLCNTVTQLESRSSLLQHLAAAHPQDQESYQCGECNASFRSKPIFSRHLSRHDPNERPHKCGCCSLRFTSRLFKERHEMFLHGIRSGWSYEKHCCISCGMKFHTSRALKKHQLDAHREQSGRYSCLVCGKSFFFKNVLNLHEKTHPAAPKKVASNSAAPDMEIKTEAVDFEETVTSTIKCYLCNTAMQMEDEMALYEHLLNGHPQQNVYHCSECNISLDEITTFNRHLQLHDVDIYPHKCALCPLRFDNVESKIQHEVNMHQLNNEAPTSSSQTQMHLHAEHINETIKNEPAETPFTQNDPTSSEKLATPLSKKYSDIISLNCYLCSTPKPFDTEFALRQHLKIHPTMFQYKCAQCEYITIQKFNFNNHHAKHDASKKPYKCSVCSFQFFTARTKRYHETSKHGIKAGATVFHCTICSKKFQSQSHLNQHQRDSSCYSVKNTANDDAQL